MERKLASVQRVLEIIPIENADAIELVRINGWQCVTKKGEFRVGDLGVFFEIDAVPPDTDAFRFLWLPKPRAGESVPPDLPTLTRPDKFRIRTLRLRGVLSQGLFMPLDTFGLKAAGSEALASHTSQSGAGQGEVTEGENVTERLSVGKYEPPVPAGMGDFRGPFPGFLPKTDEMRVQSVPAVLEELFGNPYIITLKYDGTSSTFCIDPRTGEFHACGRNFSILKGDNLYWRIARKYDLERVLTENPHLALQGEIVGPGVQKNPLGLKELSWYAFNVYDVSRATYLGAAESRRELERLGLPQVDVIETGEAFAHTQASLLSLAEGKYPGTNNEREGIVIRPQHETRSDVLGGRLSFKAISNRYLLKETD